MKHVKQFGLLFVFIVTIFFASGCKNSSQQNIAVQPVPQPKGVVFTKWDTTAIKGKKGHGRIVFLTQPIIIQNIKDFLTSLDVYYKANSITPLSMTEAQMQSLTPTIAVFNYGPLADIHSIVHVRAWRLSQVQPLDPIFGSAVIPPTPMDNAAYPGLRTFTTTTNTRPDVRRIGGNVQIVNTPANQVDFATRLDQLPADYFDYTVDAACLKDADPILTWLERIPGSTDPAVGYFIDPKTGNPKYYNYWRLRDAAGHETRVTICLEEP